MITRSQYINRITVVYALLSSAWILCSDALLFDWLSLQRAKYLSQFKGLFFVAITTGLFALALRRVASLTRQESMAVSLEHYDERQRRRLHWTVYLFTVFIMSSALFLRHEVLLAYDGMQTYYLSSLLIPAILVCAAIGSWLTGILATLIAVFGLLVSLISVNATCLPPDPIAWIMLGSLICSGILASYIVARHQLSEIQLREISARLSATLNNIVEGIVAVDRNQNITYLNPSAESLLKRTLIQVKGWPLLSLYQTKNRADLKGIYKTLVNPEAEIIISERRSRVVDEELNVVGEVISFRDETESLKLTAKLQLAEAQFHGLAEAHSDWIWRVNASFQTEYCNPAMLKSLGYERDIFYQMDQRQLVHEDDLSLFDDTVNVALSDKTGWNNVVLRWRTITGEYRVMESSATPILDVQGLLIGFHGIDRDITQRIAEEARRRIAAVAFEASEAMMITDAKGVIEQVNGAYTEITGFGRDEVIGRRPGDMVRSGRQNKEFYTDMWTQLQQQGHWSGELWNRRKNGEIYLEYLSITSVKNDNGVTTHYVGIFQDITLRKRAESEIHKLAFYDPLTELPNRRLLRERLRQALTSSQRNDSFSALFFIDLDNFKILNDTLGHDVGDELLILSAQRLQECVRESDTVARMGGDEFVVMLLDLSHSREDAARSAESIANKIKEVLLRPFMLSKHEWSISCSIGVTLFSGVTVGEDELYKQADLAMYHAKAEGKNSIRFFDPLLQEQIDRRTTLERELVEALKGQQFKLYYQAQIAQDGGLLGFESLVRWVHPERGVIPPNEFIPLAEETGLILTLGEQMLHQACQQLLRWQDHARLKSCAIAVNISAKQFKQPDFVDTIVTIVDKWKINPAQLKLELTESLLVENIQHASEKMQALKAVGVSFSLDDFGTGYSSLSYLKKLPLDQIKIDRSFVVDILSDANDAMIARAIISLAHNMNFTVVAEGVETEAQWLYLREQNCDIGQGYLFSRPLPVTEIETKFGTLE